MISAANRQKIIDTLNIYSYDVLVIGGGITGAGIALDAISRGMSVAIIDEQDFSAGTSSRSTKLVHGGLRYLKQLQFGIVAEVGQERKVVYENGIHITTPVGMLLPFYRGGQFGPKTTSMGLKLYDKLAGVRKEERRKMLNKKETLAYEPLLKQDGLLGGGHYIEYRTDDARLTIEVIKRAVELGAVALNYAKAEHFIYDEDGRICGAQVLDQIHGEDITIEAKAVINATGPWVSQTLEKDVENKETKHLLRTKGVHIVLDQSVFPLQQSIYFDAPDGRMIFAIPRGDKAYIGTTDTVYEGDSAHPKATDEDIAYLLEAMHYMFPEVKVSFKDIESTWAGVRPLIYEDGKDPSEISRKDEIWTSPSGLLTIAGGKLTGYRKMAENVVDLLVKKPYFKKFGPCITRELSLSGATMLNEENFEAYISFKGREAVDYGLTSAIGESLTRKYGSNIDDLFKIKRVTGDDFIQRGLPVELYLQVVYAMQYESAYTPADVLVRRTGKLYFDIDTVTKYLDEIVSLMNDFLGYADYEAAIKKEEMRQLIEEATHFAKEGMYE